MLYQKIRPKKLDDFIGNAPVVTALKRAIANNDRAHAYCFAGPSGCGKTTLARIMAKELGAVGAFNVLEINAASQRGIDLARTLEKIAQAAPLTTGARAVVLDEAHMLTKEAQNALLKVLEDIPEYAYYFLCSTMPSKLLKTIRTRCERIDVTPLNDGDMVDLLDDAVSRAKLKPPSDEIIGAIVDNAEGCPRIALVLLEKQNGIEDEKEALRVLKSHEVLEKDMLDFCRIVLKGDWSSVVGVYNKLKDKEPETVRRSLLGYLKSCLLKAKGGGEIQRFAMMIEELVEPTFDSGEPGLLAMICKANEIK